MTAHDYNTTNALDALVSDARFDQDGAARISGHNEAEIMLFAGYEDEQREIVRDEFGLEITNEERGASSGDTIATVVDPDGNEPEAPNVDYDRSVSSMF